MATWMKDKLDQVSDQATPADWAAMEQLINQHPALMPKPWYQTGLGISGIVTSVLAVIGVSTYLLLAPVSDDQMELPETNSISNSVTPSTTLDNVETGKEASSINYSEESAITVDESETAPANTDYAAETMAGANTGSVQAESGVRQVYTPAEQLTANEVNSNTVVDVQNSEQSAAFTPTNTPSNSTTNTSTSNTTSSVNRTTDVASSSTANSILTPERANAGNSNSGVEGVSSNASNASANSTSLAASESNSSSESGSNSTSQQVPNSNSTNATSNSSDVTDLAQADENDGGAESATNTSSNSSSTPAVLINSQEENSLRWSLAAYADYEAGTPALLENEVPVASLMSVGYGLEVEANWNGWTVNSGAMVHSEASEFASSIQTVDTGYQFYNWWEVDSVPITVIDSSWVDLGGGNGYWDKDTIDTYLMDTVQHEGVDTSIVYTQNESHRSVQGYRISLPLLIGKRWDVGQWTFGAQVGPILTIRSMSVYRNGAFSTSTYEWGADLMFRGEVGYNLYNDWYVFSRFGLRTNMKSIGVHERAAWTRRQYPISVGLQYRF